MFVYTVYKGRLIDALKETKPIDGVYRVRVQVFDLLEATRDSKEQFYKNIFEIHRRFEQMLGIKRIVFYPKNVRER